MKKYVLLADDEIHIVRAIEFKLSRAGIDVGCALDGEQAWQLIQRRVPDLLITDYQMPRLNGLELVARIRANPEMAALPVIMLSAKGFEIPVPETCREFGLVEFLTKPFSPRQLFARVEQVLADSIGSKSTELCPTLAL